MSKTKPTEAKTLGEFCAIVRRREELTQEHIAESIGVARNTVTRTEMGMIERPYNYLRFIMRYLSDKEMAHMMDLLRQIDLKNLTEK
jgi:DNA-binding XRE family transcriptional regulator